MTVYTTMTSSIGELVLTAAGEGLTGVYMEAHRHGPGVRTDWRLSDDHPVLAAARLQLAEYFEGRRTVFHLPLTPQGTEFQKRVWRALEEIPYGETISYGELARRIGNPNAARAVGLANGRNPISIIVPCHRVIGADRSLTGYGGGLHRKKQLLELEAQRAPFRLAP